MADIRRVNLELWEGNDRGCAFETEHLQIMRIRLAAGEAVPHHNANSEVLLVPLAGTIRFESGETSETFGVGEALSVDYGTPMDVSNPGPERAAFLVVKAPHPKSLLGK